VTTHDDNAAPEIRALPAGSRDAYHGASDLLENGRTASMSAKKRAANRKPDFEGRRDDAGRAAVAATPADAKPGRKHVLNIVLALLAILVLWALWRKWNPPLPPRLPPKPIEQEKADWTSTVDGPRMWSMLKRFLDQGPRVAGTPGSLKAQAMIKAELGAAGITDIREQKFTEKTPVGDVNFANIIGVLPGKRREGIAIAAHYDTKDLKELPNFVGANDAASAVVVVFELARKLKAQAGERDLTYYFVFFDGEEAFRFDWTDDPGSMEPHANWERETGQPDNTYGSRYFARKMRDEDTYPVKALVLLDMVGDKDYSLAQSADFSPELVAIFKKASIDTFGVDFFVQAMRGPGSLRDDFTPFLAEKVPCIDLIDFEYGPLGNLDYWHTHEDTLDKLSQRSLERTGTLVLAALPAVEAMLAPK
jgi:glutaminyl-peptide cyclotransferase